MAFERSIEHLTSCSAYVAAQVRKIVHRLSNSILHRNRTSVHAFIRRKKGRGNKVRSQVLLVDICSNVKLHYGCMLRMRVRVCSPPSLFPSSTTLSYKEKGRKRPRPDITEAARPKVFGLRKSPRRRSSNNNSDPTTTLGKNAPLPLPHRRGA